MEGARFLTVQARNSSTQEAERLRQKDLEIQALCYLVIYRGFGGGALGERRKTKSKMQKVENCSKIIMSIILFLRQVD